MKRAKLLKLVPGMILVALLLFVGLLVFRPQLANALGIDYFQDGGTGCDISTNDCGKVTINLMVGQTQFVRKSGVYLRAYFTTPNGSLSISGYNYCPSQPGNPDGVQNGDYYKPAANMATLAGHPVTTFTVGGTKYYGLAYPSTNGNCNKPLPITLTGMTPDPETGLYYAEINIDPVNRHTGAGGVYDGILNYFSISETSGGRKEIAQVGTNNTTSTADAQARADGYGVTAQQVGGTGFDKNITYKILFGADCNTEAGKTYFLNYYDMDGKDDGGAQVGDISMQLYDNGVLKQTWSPGTISNSTGSRGFTAQTGHKYAWYINNVYYNNTIQFSTPFDGIFHDVNCQKKTGWSVTPKTDPISPNTRPAGVPVTITFNHHLINNGPDPATYDWEILESVNGGAFVPTSGPIKGSITNQPSGNSTPKSYNKTLSNPLKGNTYCQEIEAKQRSNTNATPIYSTPSCVTIIDNNPGACTFTVKQDPARLQPGDSFKYVFSNFTSSGGTIRFATANGGPSGLVPVAAGATTVNSGNLTAPNVADSYGVTWNFTSGGPASDCTGTLNVVDLPYFHAYGAPISTGGAFDYAGDCTSGGGGVLAGWYDNKTKQSGTNYGAGSQLAAMSIMSIIGVASAQTAATRNPTDLTFANTDPTKITSDADSPLMGGYLGGTHCLTMPNEPSNYTIASSVNPLSLNSMDGAYDISDGNTVTLSGTVNTNVSIFAGDSDIYISAAGIKYNGTTWDLSTDSVPSLVVVTKGSIYIDRDVTELDGMFVASNIYTCAFQSGSTVSLVADADMYDQCGKQLTVYGSFVANQVSLMRTYGTLKDERAGWKGTGCANTVANGVATYRVNASKTCAAEVFDFSPELYLAKPALDNGSGGTIQYDSITSLPPVL